MISKKNLLLLSLLFAFTANIGCQKSDGDSSATDPQATVDAPVSAPPTPEPAPDYKVTSVSGAAISIKKVTELRDDRSNFDDFKKNLNKYRTTIQIPEEFVDKNLEIRKSLTADLVNSDYDIVPMDSAHFENGAYAVEEILSLWEKDFAQKNVTYKVYSHDTLLVELSAALIPDLIVPKTQNQFVTLAEIGLKSGKSAFGVLYFEAQSELRTQDFNISLHVDRLYVDDATVQTFSAEESLVPAIAPNAGKSGGHIEIEANEAMGKLNVFMRGTAGSKGADATAPGANGSPGSNGANEVVGRICTPGTNPRFTKPSGFSTMRALNNPLVSMGLGQCLEECIAEAQNGTQGGNGGNGSNGESGKSGGASGSIKMHVLKQSPQFTVKTENIPGVGGDGGHETNGGTSGPGGSPGAHRLCQGQPQWGPPGNPGANGIHGNQGPHGAVEVNEINIQPLSN